MKAEKRRISIRFNAVPNYCVVHLDEKDAVLSCSGGEILQEGDRVPADATVLSSVNLLADESMLTGESVSVRKTDWDGKSEEAEPGGDDLPFVYSGSMIVQGSGIARATATGTRTEIGKIGKAIGGVKEEPTRLKKEMGILVRRLTIAGFILCMLVIIIYTMTRGGLLKGFLAGITLAMAVLPEEFPVVLTIFLALGAWRISKKHVLTRKPSAIETLGSTTVLCTDKTGTLTEGEIVLDRHVDVQGKDDENVLRLIYLNSHFEAGIKSPLDDAVLKHERPKIVEYVKVDEIPFDFNRKRLSVVVRRGGEPPLQGQDIQELFQPGGFPHFGRDVRQSFQLGRSLGECNGSGGDACHKVFICMPQGQIRLCQGLVRQSQRFFASAAKSGATRSASRTSSGMG